MCNTVQIRFACFTSVSIQPRPQLLTFAAAPSTPPWDRAGKPYQLPAQAETIKYKGLYTAARLQHGLRQTASHTTASMRCKVQVAPLALDPSDVAIKNNTGSA